MRAHPEITVRAILAHGDFAGYIAAYRTPPDREVTYVIGRTYWGRGIATAALTEMIQLEGTRPLHADVAPTIWVRCIRG